MSASSREEFEKRLRSIHGATSLDSDVNMMDSHAETSNSSAQIQTPATNNEISRSEKFGRPIPQLSPALSGTNLQSFLFAQPSVTLVRQSEYLNLKNHSICARICKRALPFFQPALTDERNATVTNHVYYAGPLEQLEIYIRQHPRMLLETFNANDMQGTLVELAVIGLDQRIIGYNGVLIEGIKEKLLQLHEELEKKGVLPQGSFLQASEKAFRASLQETATERAIREGNNIAAVEQVFNAFVGNPEDSPEIKAQKIATAITTFKGFVKSLKQQMTINGIMTTNQYHVNLIHLIASAFDVLSRRGGTLQGQWYGALGDRFCFEVIGGALELPLPPRARQLIRHGLYKLFNQNQQVIRKVDVNGAIFSAGSSLGSSLFYDHFGWGVSRPARPGRVAGRLIFQTYYNNSISNQYLRHGQSNQFAGMIVESRSAALATTAMR